MALFDPEDGNRRRHILRLCRLSPTSHICWQLRAKIFRASFNGCTSSSVPRCMEILGSNRDMLVAAAATRQLPAEVKHDSIPYATTLFQSGLQHQRREVHAVEPLSWLDTVRYELTSPGLGSCHRTSSVYGTIAKANCRMTGMTIVSAMKLSAFVTLVTLI